MEALALEPVVSNENGLLQSRFELPHLVNTAKVYPLSAPNGSKIMVYGHDHGLRILWIGGRAFNPPKETPAEDEAKTNGKSSDVIMILDSDEEDAPPAQDMFKEEVTFADEEREQDTDESVLQHLDLLLGTAVLHVSFPPSQGGVSSSKLRSQPRIASQKIMMAIVCSDQSVRLINLPLTPPSPAWKAWAETRQTDNDHKHELGLYREQVLTLASHNGHQDIPNAVVITFTGRYTDPGRDGGTNDDSGEQSRTSSAGRQKNNEQEWDVLVASHAIEVTGLILIFRIPIIYSGTGATKEYMLSSDHAARFQSLHLEYPATALAFNPATYPAKRHSHLLVTDVGGVVRIHECITTRSKPVRSSSTGRRSSAYALPIPELGSWLISLYPGFENVGKGGPQRKMDSNFSIGQRKPIVATHWVLGGRALMVLLSDGEWGIWDLEGGAPYSGTDSPSRSEISKEGVKGGAKTQWTLSGWVSGVASESLGRTGGGKYGASSSFAPRTPHTRQVEEQHLFSGRQPQSKWRNGGIVTKRVASPQLGTPGHEAVAIWYDEAIILIPSLETFWSDQKRKSITNGPGTSLEPNRSASMFRLSGVKLHGNQISGIDMYPNGKRSSQGTPARHPSVARSSVVGPVLPTDILVTTTHSLIQLSTPPLVEDDLLSTGSELGLSLDQRLLPNLSLDHAGIDRALANMEDRGRGAQALSRRKVGFVGVS
ncbi:MAG: hypothetical protein M1833_004189 [Piccolia ochrophora]|nr:MAG: hypothetical protein M1833_004189 [Piccolia ochrophora]